MDIKYSIFDPTGNITALVETRVDTAEQPPTADAIMREHPQVEQVGFVYFVPGRPVPAMLRMAGGEFCGNATMSAAALYLLRSGEETDHVRVNVSGASRPVEVKLERRDDGSFDAGVLMPPPLEIATKKLKSEIPEADGSVMTVVRMEGISHIVIEESSELYYIKDDREAAEKLVKDWCRELGADCLGLMFLGRATETPDGKAADVSNEFSEGKGEGGEIEIGEESALESLKVVSGKEPELTLTPLVYVPGADTIFWENSCASGTSAVGMYLADKTGAKVDVTLREPGGSLRVTGDPAQETILYGNTKLVFSNK